MIDPEITYQQIVSGHARALTGAADTLADLAHDLDDARGRIHDASETTEWIGAAATNFHSRIARDYERTDEIIGNAFDRRRL